MATTTLINPFKVYVPSERDVVGIVADLIPNGTLRFIPRTLDKFRKGTNLAIGVILTNANGESTTLPCSKAVSKNAVDNLDSGKATKENVLGIIACLEITQFVHEKTNEVCQVISAPVSEGGEEDGFAITKANIAKAKAKMTYEDLI